MGNYKKYPLERAVKKIVEQWYDYRSGCEEVKPSARRNKYLRSLVYEVCSKHMPPLSDYRVLNPLKQIILIRRLFPFLIEKHKARLAKKVNGVLSAAIEMEFTRLNRAKRFEIKTLAKKRPGIFIVETDIPENISKQLISNIGGRVLLVTNSKETGETEDTLQYNFDYPEINRRVLMHLPEINGKYEAMVFILNSDFLLPQMSSKEYREVAQALTKITFPCYFLVAALDEEGGNAQVDRHLEENAICRYATEKEGESYRLYIPPGYRSRRRYRKP